MLHDTEWINSQNEPLRKLRSNISPATAEQEWVAHTHPGLSLQCCIRCNEDSMNVFVISGFFSYAHSMTEQEVSAQIDSKTE